MGAQSRRGLLAGAAALALARPALAMSGLERALLLGPERRSFALDFRTGQTPGAVTFSRASAATYFDASGTLRTATTNVPRLAYDPVSHAPLGLWMEGQSTNLLAYSTPGGTGWTAIGMLSATATPLCGSLPANALTPNSATSNTFQTSVSGVTLPAGSATVSMVAKSLGTNAYIQVNLTNGTSTYASVAYADLTNGVAVVGADLLAGMTGKSASIVPEGAGTYRFSFSFTVPTGFTTANIYIGTCLVVSSTGDNRTYTGTLGQGIIAGGAQLEAMPFPTSYIATAGSAVTRAGDVALLSGTAFAQAINAAQGAVFVDAMIPNTTPSGSFPSLVDLDSWYANKMAMWANQPPGAGTINVVREVGGTLNGSMLNGGFYFGTPFRVGMRWSPAGLSGAVSGSAVVTNAGPLPPVTQMMLGNANLNGTPLNGYIQRVQILKYAPSDAAFQAMSNPGVVVR